MGTTRTTTMALVVLVVLAPAAWAGIIGPYTVDSSTLHLYHLDEDDLASSSADATGAQHMNGLLNGATLGNTAYTGFNGALDTSANALVPSNASGSVPPHRPVLLGAAALSNAGADNVTLDWAGADGAFTMEAMINFDDSFDPAAANYRNAGAATGGNYPMEIVSGEGDANGPRLFQFRVNQIGTGTSSGANGVTQPRVEVANLRGIVSNQSIAVDIPTTGLHAINNTDWFHVAVAYDGNAGAAGSLLFYWTKVDPSVESANLIGTAMLNMDPVEGLTGFAIGNESRDSGSGAGEGESFVGRIDEVRISSVARGANQYIFVPEPTSWLLAMMGLAAVASLRKRAAR
ncbi:MAG: PEP-CTERM sorting domain-containing protein [Pirellulales bacterium]